MSIASIAQVSLEIKPLGASTYALSVAFDIEDYDGLYEQYVRFSIDAPDIVLSKVRCSVEPVIQYAPAFKDSKSVFLGPCTFSAIINAPSNDSLKNAQLYVTYQLLSKKHSTLIALPLGQRRLVADEHEVQTHIDASHTITHHTHIPEQPLIDSKPARLAQPSAKPEPADPIPLVLLGFLCAIAGLALLFKARYAKRFSWRPLAASLGMALIACSVVLAAKAYQAQYEESHPSFQIK